jgi:hypothetical protein
MPHYRFLLSFAACVAVTASMLAEEPPCAANFRSGGQSSETFVLTSLAPQAVIERLPRKLAAAGATMKWTDPAKGILAAEGLNVKAEIAGTATRVTFLSSAAADRETLCRYASLVGKPPAPPKAAVAQDPALIAQMKDDLIKKHQIVADGSRGLNNATFTKTADFLEFVIDEIQDVAAGKRQYDVSMLLPRKACGIGVEDMEDGSAGLLGQRAEVRTKPARVAATLAYTNENGTWHLTTATITHIESTK